MQHDTTGAAARDDAGSRVASAARRLLDRDGHGLVLQPWQAAYLVATADGREGVVPPGCGVGRAWLQARLDEEMAAAEATGPGPGTGP